MAASVRLSVVLVIVTVLVISLTLVSGIAVPFATPKINVQFNTPPGTLVTQLQKEGQSFHLTPSTPSDDYFKITEDGKLLTKKWLTDLLDHSLIVNVQHTIGDRSWNEQINVRVVDTKDTKLYFADMVYKGFITENTVGERVGGLSELQVVVPSYARGMPIHYELSGQGSENFHIFVSPEDHIVKVYAEGTLHLAEKELYTLTLEAIVNDEVATTKVQILVLGLHAPVFVFPFFVYSIMENSPAGTEAGSVYATDEDKFENGRVSYRLVEPSKYFTIGKDTGRVIVKTPPPAGDYNMQVVAMDAGTPHKETSPVPLTITVVSSSSGKIPYGSDIVFPPVHKASHRQRRAVLPEERITVPEDTASNSVIYTVANFNDTDRAAFKAPVNPLFAVNETTGEVSLVGMLNFEDQAQQKFELEITSTTDLGKRDTQEVVVDIEDAEEPPEWAIMVYPYIEVVPIDAPNGASIYELRATDPEGTTINYFLNSGGNGMFTVDKETGWIKTRLMSGQTYEQNKEYILSVYAEDRNGSRVNGKVSIFGGSHRPQFTKPRYQATVTEEMNANQRVIEVGAFSFSNNVGITYSILDSEDPRIPQHSIGRTTGVITLTERVDREVLGSYFLNVQATEDIQGGMSSEVRIDVEVADINDCDPEFDRSTFTFRDIPETIDTNTPIGTVQATDCDIAPNNIIVYSLTGPDAFKYRITDSGEIYPVTELDCDVGDCIDEFEVSVLGGNRPASVLVYLKDVNDEPPVFLNTDGSVYYVDEDAASGYKVGTVYANDADKDSTIKFGIQGTNTFQINPITGVITRVGTGNLPEASYLFNVTATDNDNTHIAYAEVTIQVNDINDNVPVFPDCASYTPNITEAAPEDTFLIQVTATDADKGANAQIKYGLVGANVEFRIDPDTGEIFTRDRLDREATPYIEIVVKAADQPKNLYRNTAFCRITVTINDANDNEPTFPLELYIVDLSVTAPLLEPFLTVEAEDADENPQIVYSLMDLSGAPFGIFGGGIVPTSDLNQYSGQTFSFKVKAEDGINSGTSEVQVKISTGANTPPVFIGTYPPVSVPENASVNYVIDTVSVQPGNEKVVFTIVTGQIPETNSRVKFRFTQGFDFYSENAFVKNKLDYETTPRYELEMQAQNGINKLSSFMTLTVLVEDVNDEPPQFPLAAFDVASPEERNPDFTVITVQAQDADTNPRFSTITYSLDPGFPDAANFTINPVTGEIISKIKFDREVKDVYSLKVGAEDGAPSSLPELQGKPNSDSMSLTINVVDINDNSPVFPETLYTRTISEDEAVGTEVITVTATDVDSDSTPRYLITTNNTAGAFDVDPATGEISIASPLDYETQREYWLEYTANDGLNVATTTIHFKLTNVNDEKPVFDEDVYRVSVVEEDDTNLPLQLIQVQAVDGDGDGVQYSLEGTGGSSTFTINAQTGWISLNEKLDREEEDRWILLVKATDVEPSRRMLTGYADLEVTVTDINDNNPYFPNLEYRGSVPENSAPGTEVEWTPSPVRAIDLDDPSTNGRITYSIVTGSGIPDDGADFFSIGGSTGRVTVSQDAAVTPGVTLDRETKDMYTLRIRAEDNSGGFAEIDTTIQVLDTNDNSPTFIGGPYTTSVPETKPVGSTVYEVPVSDADVDFRDQVQFSITAGNEQNHFDIVSDPVTLIGIIQIANPLDFESPPTMYTLSLEVTDGVNVASRTTIQITVEDVNDVAPAFTGLPYAITISEGEDVGFVVYTVTAQDGEANEFGQFTFSIDPMSDPDGLYTISDPIGSGASRTAEVSINKKLDREKVAVQELILRATDQGEPPLTGTATLTVTLDDVNDTPPRFAENYQPKIREELAEVQFVASIFAVDDDPTGGEPFYLEVVNTPDTVNFTWSVAGAYPLDISTKPIAFDREKQAFYTIPIEMTDLYPNGNTGIRDLIVEVEDINDNPHKGVTKDMLVYSFEGNIPSSSIGFVGVEDLDTIEDKTYFPQPDLPKEYFDVNSDTGNVTILAGTPAGKYSFKVIVKDDGTYPDQTSTVNVDVRDISEEAVRSSGSFRFEGVTAEQLIAKPADGSPSKVDVLKSILVDIIPAKEENIDIFSIINVPGVMNQVDVRYSAHGSPFYPPEKMDGAALANRDRIAEELGVTIGMIKIDMCLMESACESACTNDLVIDPTPTVVNAPSASFTSITTYTVARCVCGANIRQPGLCDFDACLNGGTCMETQGGGHTCKCPQGFDGPNCEQTTREFKAGFATFGSLQQCEQTHTSLEFITTLPQGVLLYNGPMIPLGDDLPQDFMLIQLSASGQPTLDIDLGSGKLSLTIASNANLGDGEWHRLDVYRNGKDVEFMLDRCRAATVAEASSSSDIQQTELCKSTGMTPGDNKFLNVNTPLQLGGIDQSDAFTYPSGITFEQSFDGCMKNIDQDGMIYDLQTPGKAQQSTAGCSRLECGECNDGKCVGGFNSYVCLCNPGFTGTTCNAETPAYDFATDSYVRYQLTDATLINSREANYQVMFRTRERAGLLWTITNANGLEFTTVELYNGFIRCRWNLGDGEFSMYLDKYAVDDGDWHAVQLERFDDAVTVRIDGGGGVRQMENRESTHSALDVDPNSLLLGAFVVRVVEISQDFQGCMNDPRINNFYLGFDGTTKYGSALPSDGVSEGCSSHNPCESNPCPALFVCIDLWRKYTCGCAPGSIEQGGTCVNVNDCDPNPCLNGGTCEDQVDGFRCKCLEDYTGDKCETKREPYVAPPLALGLGAILAMILCLLLIILMLLAFVFYKRSQDRKQALAFAIDPDDDIRETFINYDEEGGGEGDQDAYDVSTLRKPIRPVPMDDYVKPPVTDAPLSRAPRLPGDDPNVGDFINDRLKDANDDPDAYPNDSTKEYDYEGDGSSAGSLSSLNSSSTDGDQNYDYLNDWGPPFKKLADMYGGGEDD